MSEQPLPFAETGKPLPRVRSGKPQVKLQRPSWRYSPDIAALICRHVSRGGSLRDLEAMKVCSRPTVASWRRQYPEFEKRFAAAQAKRMAARRSWEVLKWFKGPVAPECANAALTQDALRKWFGVRAQAAQVITILFRNTGKPTTAAALAEEVGSTPKSIVVEMVTVRSAMDCEAVDGEKGVGYWLTEVGVAECRAALCRMGEEYTRMGEELRRAG